MKHSTKPPRSKGSPTLRQRLANVKLFLCDVDGVLTDGTVLMGNGGETKRFSIQDGLGLRLLQKHGIKVGWVSRRPSAATTKRAQDLKVDFLYQADGSKVTGVQTILARSGLSWAEVCYVGDDIVDLGVLKRAGVAVAVANGIYEAKESADYVTRASGGHGAVRGGGQIVLETPGEWKRPGPEFFSSFPALAFKKGSAFRLWFNGFGRLGLPCVALFQRDP